MTFCDSVWKIYSLMMSILRKLRFVRTNVYILILTAFIVYLLYRHSKTPGELRNEWDVDEKAEVEQGPVFNPANPDIQENLAADGMNPPVAGDNVGGNDYNQLPIEKELELAAQQQPDQQPVENAVPDQPELQQQQQQIDVAQEAPDQLEAQQVVVPAEAQQAVDAAAQPVQVEGDQVQMNPPADGAL